MAAKVTSAKAALISSLPTTTGYLAQRTEASKLHGTDVNSMYIPLLGGIDDTAHPGKPDHRVELFIAQLRKEANFNKQEGESYTAVRTMSISVKKGIDLNRGRVIKPTSERIKKDEGNVQFKRPLSWMFDKEALYNEMLVFLCELTKRLHNQLVSSEAINFIKTIPGMPDAGERNFAIAVVQTFVREISNGTTDIIEQPQEWANTIKGQYYSKVKIIESLFGYKGTIITSEYYDNFADMPDEGIMKTYRDEIFAKDCPLPTNRVFTSYALDRFLQKQVEAAINQIEKVENDASTKPSPTPKLTTLNSTLLDNLKKYDKSIKPVENYRYIRKEDKQLYIQTPDGTEKRAKDFTIDDACKATGLNDENPNYRTFCNNFLQDCINGKNVGACADFLKSSIFWSKGVVDYLDNINLFLAHLALEKYKIPHVDVNGIVMYDTVAAWHKKLDEYASKKEEGLDTTSVGAIKANEALNAVIEGIIGQINARPAILNPDAIGDTVIEEAKTPSPVLALLRGTNNLHPSQPKGRIALGEVKVIVDKHVEEINARLDAIKKLSPHMLRHIAGSPNILMHPMFNQLFLHSRPLRGGNQAGGDRIKIDQYNVQSTDFYDHYKNIEKLIKLTDTGEMPAWLYTTVKNTETILTQNGINIAKGDLDHIYKVIENLNKVEKQILFALKGAMKFALVLNSDIGPVVKDQPSDKGADDASFNGLYAFKHKTIDQMFKMFEIAINKLEKYCSKTNKVGGLCSYLVDLSQ